MLKVFKAVTSEEEKKMRVRRGMRDESRGGSGECWAHVTLPTGKPFTGATYEDTINHMIRGIRMR